MASDSTRLFWICLIHSLIISANAGWCYYGGCHVETGIFEKACPSMADSIGRDNMRILFQTSCDRWHEKIWGKKNFCCTNDCKHQECGMSCANLRMKAVEENDHTKPNRCVTKNFRGQDIDANSNFCCDQ